MQMLRETEGMGALLRTADMLGVTSPRTGYRASKRSRAPVSYLPKVSYISDEEFDNLVYEVHRGHDDKPNPKNYRGWSIPGEGAYVRGSIKGKPYGRVVEAHELYEQLYPGMEHGDLHRKALDYLAGTDPEAYRVGVADLQRELYNGGSESRTFANDVLYRGRGMPAGETSEPKEAYRQRENSGPQRRIDAKLNENKGINAARREADRLARLRGEEPAQWDPLSEELDEKTPGYRRKDFYEPTDYLEVLSEYVMPRWFGPKGWVTDLKGKIESFSPAAYCSGTLRNTLYGNTKDGIAVYFQNPNNAFGKFHKRVNG